MLAHLLIGTFLGIVQGLTEFLPVSSTAHLLIFEKLFGLSQQDYGLSFDVFTSLGTTIALLLYFRRELWETFRLLRLRPRSEAERLPWWILGVTVLVGVAGYFAEPYVESGFRSLWIVIFTLILFGVVMMLAERLHLRRRNPATLTAGRAYGIGLAQILAFVPGVSRSGSTISTGLFLGMNRQDAAKYSFLLSVPITTLAILKRLTVIRGEWQAGLLTAQTLLVYLLAAVAAGVVGYLVIHYFLRYLGKHSLTGFAYYRFFLALLLLLYLASGHPS